MDEPLCSWTRERWSEFSNATEVKEGSLADMVDVISEAKMGVKPDSQVSNGGGEGKVVAKEGNRGNVGGTELIRGAYMNGLSFGAVQLQKVLAHPSLYLLQAGIQESDRGGGDLEVELCVVSIAVELYSMPADDTTKREHVDGEKGWTEHRALGDPTDNSVGEGFRVPQGYELGPSREIGMKPFEGSARDADVVLEAVKEDVVVNGIKCSREVEKDE